jgi:small conductance mechanosensitive channel
VVMIGGAFGKVDLVSVMHTRLRTFDGKVVYIPNHKVLNDQVVNTSLRPKRRLDINFFIPYEADVPKVKKIVGEILKESEIVQEKPVPRVVIDKFAPGYMEMKARFWVEKKYALVGRWGLNEKIMARFDEEGVRMASPRLEIDEMPARGVHEISEGPSGQ